MATIKDRHIHEGWYVSDFIKDLALQISWIMNGESWRKPFTSKRELSEWCKDNQPYYKRTIPEVNNHFAKLYNLT